MPDSPGFSIIVTDYDRSVPRDHFRRKMACLASQTCKDFEVLVYHDGPKQLSYDEELGGQGIHPDTRFIITDARANDWGHTNRDSGIRAARGRWIIHTNADNLFYPTLIEKLKAVAESDAVSLRPTGRKYPILAKSLLKRSDRLFGTTYVQQTWSETREHEIIVFGVLMRGMLPVGKTYRRLPRLTESHAIIFGGVPVRRGAIDAMQFVMRRDLWLAHGGWYDRTEEGDGHMYERFAGIHAVTPLPEVLGEHW